MADGELIVMEMRIGFEEDCMHKWAFEPRSEKKRNNLKYNSRLTLEILAMSEEEKMKIPLTQIFD